jgi:pimeloyl-ACP methyl ester carboxylesterase
MLRFASSATLTNATPFSKDDVIHGTRADPARRDEAGYLWTEADGGPECLRFYGSPAGEGLPLVWLDGDVIDRGNRFNGDIVVGGWYSQITPLTKQLQFELYAAALARPLIYLARPGCHGSSGDHAQRRRPREVVLIDDALNQLSQAFGWDRFDLAGFSGGGHLVGALLARRSDIDCAVIASGNVAVRMRIERFGWSSDVTGYADFVDPIASVAAVAQHPPRRLVMLTDPHDVVVPADCQTAYAQALRAAGVAVEHRFVTAFDDPRHHILRYTALLAAASLR